MDAVVTLKLSPGELRRICEALETATAVALSEGENQDLHARDRQTAKAEALQYGDLLKKLT